MKAVNSNLTTSGSVQMNRPSVQPTFTGARQLGQRTAPKQDRLTRKMIASYFDSNASNYDDVIKYVTYDKGSHYFIYQVGTSTPITIKPSLCMHNSIRMVVGTDKYAHLVCQPISTLNPAPSCATGTGVTQTVMFCNPQETVQAPGSGPLPAPRTMSSLTQKMVNKYFDPTFMKSALYNKIKGYLSVTDDGKTMMFSFGDGRTSVSIKLNLCKTGTVQMNDSYNFVCSPLSTAACMPSSEETNEQGVKLCAPYAPTSSKKSRKK